MLYLVATPIGNLQDITFRAIEVLRNCDYILCEDTRHTCRLLEHYKIHKPLKSFHQFNEKCKEETILQDLSTHKTIALVSDAGTPGISDPGERLVKRCIEQGIVVTAVPGPCAALVALSCSGFSTQRFQFVGFLSRKKAALQKELQAILAYPGTTVCYESPHRLMALLKSLQELAPDRMIAIARELTKKFEQIQRGTVTQLLHHWQEVDSVKGEIVLLIAEETEKTGAEWNCLSPEEHVAFLENTYHLSRKDAIKTAAEMRGVPKREIYNLLQKQRDI